MIAHQRIVALEGGVCAGKSTASRIVQVKGVAVGAPDYMELLPGEIHDAVSKLAPLDRASTILRLDRDRLKRAGLDQMRVVLDRCALTVFAFEYACAATGRNPPEPRLVELAYTHDLIRPHAVIFLDISDDERTNRELTRQNRVLPMLLEPQFNGAIREFFLAAANFIPVKFIDSVKSSAEAIATDIEKELDLIDFDPPEMRLWVDLVSWAFSR